MTWFSIQKTKYLVIEIFPEYFLASGVGSKRTIGITIHYLTSPLCNSSNLISSICKGLTPGLLTDLRAALVNNNTFASLLVRLGLHKFILFINQKLQAYIDRFVEFLEDKRYQIDDEVLILLDEDELLLAEQLDVPKALGDVFEALAGAVYLDSGKDLKTVWRVFHKIMWNELELFSQNVPKNSVKRLYEWHGAHPQFGNVMLTQNSKVIVPLQFLMNGVPKLVHGCGANKMMAKKAAAKLALRFLDS
ncbi:unnamed protein product [Acanthoscelides obtectus]|uniref:Uncharacterized protein n=1 Tax=Acanthoscelides obtectus TaxID=200917 RepID=A0A9P0P1R4_ACAOB|nr:unnamed protein product [Acanthoscelides obtectus]CAK1631523.1 Endoribonuclease Dcr-1 [Acanthoscelides obtectus]